jgi:hypothetical protein
MRAIPIEHLIDETPQESSFEAFVCPEENFRETRIIPKRKFTHEEDLCLVALVEKYGTKNWPIVAQAMATRNIRQCRERWTNYLHPYLRTGSWTAEEDQRLEEKFAEYGTKWNKISKFFIHRAPLSLRNRHMALVRRQRKMTVPAFVQPFVTSTQRKDGAPAPHIRTPFSDEELKMLLEDIFA